jgi:hypothetical protein
MPIQGLQLSAKFTISVRVCTRAAPAAAFLLAATNAIALTVTVAVIG